MKPHFPISRSKMAVTAFVVVSAAAAGAILVTGRPAGAVPPIASEGGDAVPPTALTVETISPQQVSITRKITASGSIQARDELLVGSDAQGVRLIDVKVDVGARVRRGDMLARGDDSQLLAQIAQQDATIRQSRTELALARANLERAISVQDSGVYSVEAIQTRRTAAEAAEAKLDLVLAQRQELGVRLAQTRVLAPADGVISRRSATVGAVMSPGMELFRLIRDDEVEWRAELPDTVLAAVRPGTLVKLRPDEQRVIEGRVRVVAPTVDSRTRNGLVYVTLPRGTSLKAGSHAQGDLMTDTAVVWVLPESAVLMRDGQPYVYLLGDRGVARSTRVTTGVRQGGIVEVIGLSPGAQVVSTGTGFVKDGERVRVARPEGRIGGGHS